MVNALVLNNGKLTLRPYHEWLKEAGFTGDLVLLASKEQLDRYGETLPDWGYVHAEAVQEYEESGRLEARALELARRYDIGYILACQEQDLERAGVLRDLLGLPGQDLASARAFRDKLVMKNAARAGGVPVAEYQELQTPLDLLAFERRHGLPVVVKPRNGSASKDLSIIRTRAELASFLAGLAWDEESEPNYLLESYVPGGMYHVDGLVADGRVVVAWPGQYLYELASFASDGAPRLTVTLDPDDPMTGRLLAFTNLVLTALPTPRDTTFHAEVFHTPDDELVLCEIASRNGGAWIKELIRAMFGFDLPTARVLAQMDLPLPVATDGTVLPRQMAGQVLLTRRAGRVRSVPDRLPFPWIERYQPFVKAGDVMHQAVSSADFMAAMVVSAPDRTTCVARQRQAADWFLDNLELEPLNAEEHA